MYASTVKTEWIAFCLFTGHGAMAYLLWTWTVWFGCPTLPLVSVNQVLPTLLLAFANLVLLSIPSSLLYTPCSRCISHHFINWHAM